MKQATILILLWAGVASGQTACSTTTPCVPVQITGTGSTATLFTCMGAATQCSSTALSAHISTPVAGDVWHTAGTFPQKAATVTYNDPEPYGALMNYAALNTSSGGAAGPVSAIVVFQVPAATQTAPSLTAGPSIVTTGTAGPQ